MPSCTPQTRLYFINQVHNETLCIQKILKKINPSKKKKKKKIFFLPFRFHCLISYVLDDVQYNGSILHTLNALQFKELLRQLHYSKNIASSILCPFCVTSFGQTLLTTLWLNDFYCESCAIIFRMNNQWETNIIIVVYLNK